MVEARHLKADDDEPLVIASEIMHREWFQWLLAQARLHEPPHITGYPAAVEDAGSDMGWP